MSGAKYMDSALYMMEVGLPVEVLTNTTLTMAVGRGIHSIDVGLIIAPAIHKEIVSIAEMAGIEYDEYFPEEEEEKEAAKERIKAVIIAKMKRKKPKEKTQISQTMEAMTSPEQRSLKICKTHRTNKRLLQKTWLWISNHSRKNHKSHLIKWAWA